MRVRFVYSGGAVRRVPGMTLMECVLATALIAFVLPAVMLVLAQSQSKAQSVKMDGEAQRAMFCHAAQFLREGAPKDAHQLVWGHASSGACLGRVSDIAYRDGLSRYQGRVVYYFVLVKWGDLVSPISNLKPLQLSLEYPASAPAQHRKRRSVHTLFCS